MPLGNLKLCPVVGGLNSVRSSLAHSVRLLYVQRIKWKKFNSQIHLLSYFHF